MSLENFRKETLAAARILSEQIEAQWPDFSLIFVVYRRGQRQDECERILAALKGHICETSAEDLLRNKNMGPDHSALLGIASGASKGFMGFGRKTSFLGFAALNLDLYTRIEDALYDLYHLSAQAIDTFKLINKKAMTFDGPDIIMQPKRNQLSLSRNNLKSDVFSALAMHMNGHEDAVRDLARMRARKALNTQTFYRPEDYPFVIATDVLNYTIENSMGNRKESILALYNLAGKIAMSFDKHNLKAWTEFAGPAQVMAWNGFTEEQILGTAISTSDDPFIKATGNLICEITHIVPETPKTTPNAGNPYIDDQGNQVNHTRLSEETFELAIIHAVEAESHLPLIRIANNQNEALLKGRVLGWCADALQSAAKTFEHSMKKGLAPAPASRIEFQRLASKLEWHSLNSLNGYMVAQRRNGNAMTYDEIADWCTSRFDLRPVMDSIVMTMNDPAYTQKLQAASELPMPGPRLAATPAPQAVPQAAPQIAPAHSIGMGGGMMSGGMGSVPQQARTAPALHEGGDKEEGK